MSNNNAYGHLHVELDDVMVAVETVDDARRCIHTAIADDTERTTFLDMLGIGDDLAWNMGAA